MLDETPGGRRMTDLPVAARLLHAASEEEPRAFGRLLPDSGLVKSHTPLGKIDLSRATCADVNATL